MEIHLHPDEIIAPRQRPDVTIGRTEKVVTGCGNLYVTVNEDEEGLCEMFTRMGKSGGCTNSYSEAVGRLVSLSLRAGVKTSSIAEQLRGVRCPLPYGIGKNAVLSCPDAVGQVLGKYISNENGNGKALGNPSSTSSESLPFMTMESASQTAGTSVEVDYVDSLEMGVCPECPECGHMVEFVEGCLTCRGCGYSKC